MKYTKITITELIGKLKLIPDQNKKYNIQLDEYYSKNNKNQSILRSWSQIIESVSKSHETKTHDIISSILSLIDIKSEELTTSQEQELNTYVSILVSTPFEKQQQTILDVLTSIHEQDVTTPNDIRINETIDIIKQVFLKKHDADLEKNIDLTSNTQHQIHQEIVIVDEQMNPIKKNDNLKPPGEVFFDKTHDVFHMLENVHREKRWLDCDIIDISDKHGALACVAQSLHSNKYRVVINSGTYRFNNVKNNKLMLALHVAECVFRCVLEFTDTSYNLKTLDTLLDQFHDRFINDFKDIGE